MKKISTILCITLLLLPIVSVSALKNNTIEPISCVTRSVQLA